MLVYRPIGNELVRKEEIAERVLIQGKDAVRSALGKSLDIRVGEPMRSKLALRAAFRITTRALSRKYYAKSRYNHGKVTTRRVKCNFF